MKLNIKTISHTLAVALIVIAMGHSANAMKENGKKGVFSNEENKKILNENIPSNTLSKTVKKENRFVDLKICFLYYIYGGIDTDKELVKLLNCICKKMHASTRITKYKPGANSDIKDILDFIEKHPYLIEINLMDLNKHITDRLDSNLQNLIIATIIEHTSKYDLKSLNIYDLDDVSNERLILLIQKFGPRLRLLGLGNAMRPSNLSSELISMTADLCNNVVALYLGSLRSSRLAGDDQEEAIKKFATKFCSLRSVVIAMDSDADFFAYNLIKNNQKTLKSITFKVRDSKSPDVMSMISGCKFLESLDCSEVKIPQLTKGCPNMKELTLGHDLTDDDLLLLIEAYQNTIEKLDITYNCNITGKAYVELFTKCKKLTDLIIMGAKHSHVDVTDDCIDVIIKNLTCLKWLVLLDTELTPEGEKRLKEAMQETKIVLHDYDCEKFGSFESTQWVGKISWLFGKKRKIK